MLANAQLSLAGRTLRWKFPGGPTGDKVYEHTFREDGTVVFHEVHPPTEPAPAREPVSKRKQDISYESFEVGPGMHMMSYLSDSGYTLTVLANLGSGAVYGFASNGLEWHPLIGSLEPM